MLFNSFEYLIFLPLVSVLFFIVPHRYRWLHLLVSSYVFYMWWSPLYALLIMASTLVDYCACLFMGTRSTSLRRHMGLAASLACNLGLLFSFKYYNLFTNTAVFLFDKLGISWSPPAFSVLLPVGISFYTFQTLAYTIDVFMGRQRPERHFGFFALYVSFFPQLVAGPIERSGNLLPQLHARQFFSAPDAVMGLRLILWGLFKKMVVADRLSELADIVYADPGSFPGGLVAMATAAFAFQIYCDFSGYSDVAIGSARILGIRLMTNFRRPYAASSIPEFWARWHISLSTWFRDYLFIPLGGSRVNGHAWARNILIVFAVSGLWHGASWTFVVWGFLHGVLYLLARGVSSAWDRLGMPPLAAWTRPGFVVLNFCVVLVTWVFFRAATIHDAAHAITQMATGWGLPVLPWKTGLFLTVSRLTMISALDLEIMTALVIFLLAIEHWLGDRPADVALGKLPAFLRWGAYVLLTMAVLNLGAVEEKPFVYFQF